MKVSPIDVIKEWQSILPVIKSAPFNDGVLNEADSIIALDEFPIITSANFKIEK